ncbi:CoA transferase, partial [Streptomyces sp. NE06-03E]|nr:CoA transferase [Streptomyces sp. NE06-03E]
CSTYVEHGGLIQPAPAPRFSATPVSVRGGPALPGADTEAVAEEWGLPGLLTTGKETTG